MEFLTILYVCINIHLLWQLNTTQNDTSSLALFVRSFKAMGICAVFSLIVGILAIAKMW